MIQTDYTARAIRTLDHGQRVRYFLFFIPQVLISLVEVAGVALIGFTIVLAQESQVSSNPAVFNLLSVLGVFEISQEAMIVFLVSTSAICFLIKGLAAPYFQRKVLIFLGKISMGQCADLERRLYARDIIFNQRRTTQETSTLLTDSTFLAYQGMLGGLSLVISEMLLIVFLSTLLLYVNFALTIFIFIYFLLILLLLNSSSKSAIRKQSGIVFESSLLARTNVQESLISYREVYVSQNVQSVVTRTHDSLEKSVNARANLTWLQLFPKYILDIMLIIGIILVGGFTYAFTDKQEAITVSVLFLATASRLMPCLLRMNTGFQGINNSRDAADRLFEFSLELQESESLSNAFSTKTVSHNDSNYDFKIEQLSFRYPGSEKPIISNLSFSIPFGQFLAIAGPSGSGKSTLVDLLMGVIEDQSGSIAIGGLSPRQRVQHNPGLIGYVPQKVSMLNRTLKENVAIGVNAHDINEERVLAALEKVALGDVVFSLKDGIETIVGENGYNFSGGQIQRIGLARAIYTNPSILILDEATSALDAQTELAISESLAALEGEKTIIVVAHRLATVRKANKILYLGAENSFELGTFEELREQVPSFDKQAKLLGL